MPYNNAAGLMAQEVMNNPSLVPNLPFVNDVWPGYKNVLFSRQRVGELFL